MALLELGGRRFTVPAGDTLLGTDASCAIALEGEGLLPKHAVLQGMPDGQVVIRKAAPHAEIRINGVRLGAEPTPLLHGDKVEVGGHELTFVDERRSGSTQYIPVMKVADRGVSATQEAGGGARPAQETASTGGRVVCLTDGREYQVTDNSLVFGRDAASDVVVPGNDVSRRHCEIIQTPKGYLLVDSSTNGTFVNEERVQGQRMLARADIIRIGDEQFRFYADRPTPAPAPQLPVATPAAPARPATAAPQEAPAGARERLKETMHGLPVQRPQKGPGEGGPLAAFLVKQGDLRGQRLTVRAPVVNIGRADYNDIILPDASVSTAHAKLQRREGVWVLTDLDSTNGTFVDGDRLKGETALSPGAAIRLGDVQLVFEPRDDMIAVAKGGGTQVMGRAEPKQPPSVAPGASAPAAAPAPAPTPAAPRGSAPPKPAAPAPPAAPPRAPAPPPPKPAPPQKPAAPARPGRPGAGGAKAPPPRPGAQKRPAGKAPEPKKGKGCGSSAALLVLGTAALIYWLMV